MLAERRCPTTPGSSGPWPAYFPPRIAGASSPASWRTTRCAARSSPTRWSTRWSTGAASPSRSGPGRRRERPRSRSPARSWSAARSSGWPTSCVRSRRSTTSCRTAVQSALYLEFRRLLDRSVRWFLTARPSHARHRVPRSSGSLGHRPRLRAQVAELLRGEEKRRLDRKAAELVKRGVPDELAAARGVPARLVLAARHRRHRHRHRPRPERHRPAVLPGLGAVRHRRDAHARSPACRATTAGTPWPVAPCATTCTPCSSR